MKNVSALGKRKASTPSYAVKDATKNNKPHKVAPKANGVTPKKVYKTLAYQLQGNFSTVADPEKRALLSKSMARGMKAMIYGTKINQTNGRYNTGKVQ